MKAKRRLATTLSAATTALALLLLLRPLPASRSIAIWILFVAALALSRLVGSMRVADPAGARAEARFDAALRRPRRGPALPAELIQLERELTLAVGSGTFAHQRLLPRLRSIAAARLSSRRGIDIVRSPDAARSLLGEEAWKLARPDPQEPSDTRAPGVPLAQIEALLDRLEAL
jgi:hypothetical protein